MSIQTPFFCEKITGNHPVASTHLWLGLPLPLLCLAALLTSPSRMRSCCCSRSPAWWSSSSGASSELISSTELQSGRRMFSVFRTRLYDDTASAKRLLSQDIDHAVTVLYSCSGIMLLQVTLDLTLICLI